MKNMSKQKDILRNIAGQWAVICFFPAAFLSAAFVSGMGFDTHRLRHLAAALALMTGTVFLSLVWVMLSIQDKKYKENFKKKIRSDRYLYGVLLVSGILRSFSLNVMQRWDAGEYYYKLGNACENFDFTWEAFFEQFRLCGHPTLGFAPIYAIGEFFAPRKIWGMELVNLALTLAAIFCIYRILEKLLLKCDSRRLALYTFLISCGPLFLGTFQNFNPDFGIALFGVFVIYSCLYKQYFLMFFWGCVVVQTKETGIVMQAGLALGLVLHSFFGSRLPLAERVRGVFKNPAVLAAGSSVLLQLGYMKLIGGMTSWASEDQQRFVWNNEGMNCFGFRIDFILTKLKQFFLLNFNWIYLAVIFAGIIIVLFRRQKGKRLSEGMFLLWAVSGSLFLFLNLYITGALARYNLFCDLVLAITGVVVIETLFLEKTRYLITVPCVGLMLLQSYITVDPVSRAVFPHVETGMADMLYMQMPSEEIYYGDTLVYNYQYTFIDRALDKCFAEGFQEDAVNVVHVGYSHGDGSQFNGNCWQDWVPYKLRWDKKQEKRVHYKSEDTVRINVFGEEWLVEWFKQGKAGDMDKAVLIFLPQYEYDQDTCLEQLEPLFEIGEKQTYRSILGCVDYYELHAK